MPNKPTYSPPYTPPPNSPPTKCPNVDDKVCTLGSGNAKCPTEKSCKSVCGPKFCKLPDQDHHKIYGAGHQKDNRYVKLGSICGYMKYVEGEPKHQHKVEVCCVVKDDVVVPSFVMDTDMKYGQCAGCGDCSFPQKLSDVCCLLANAAADSKTDAGRDSTYPPECDYETEVCCKCGHDTYTSKCIEKHEACEKCERIIPPPECNTKKHDLIGPFFQNTIANALDPSFKYEPWVIILITMRMLATQVTSPWKWVSWRIMSLVSHARPRAA